MSIWLWLVFIAVLSALLGPLFMPFTPVTGPLYYLCCLLLGAGGTALGLRMGWVR